MSELDWYDEPIPVPNPRDYAVPAAQHHFTVEPVSGQIVELYCERCSALLGTHMKDELSRVIPAYGITHACTPPYRLYRADPEPPEGSIVRDRGGAAWHHYFEGSWSTAGNECEFSWKNVQDAGPLTLLYRGDDE